MNDETLKAISSVDSFHKNCLLLFEDVVSTIKEKTLADNMSNLVGPEGYYQVWNANESEHQMKYAFQHDNRIRFVCMYVKLKENKLPSNSVGYKKVCRELNVDPIYPLIIVFGLFEPRDISRFLEQLNMRRIWMEYILLLQVSDKIRKNITRTTPYEFEKILEFQTDENTDSWYCEKSLFKIKKLADVKDSYGIQSLVDELLSISP